jgi:RNA polymerase-binding transcription factor DksA
MGFAGSLDTVGDTTMATSIEASVPLIRERLDAREAELRAAVREARAAAAERPSAQGPQVEDPGEEGEQRVRSGIEHAEMQRHLEELREIDDARTRIGNGRYGECVDCGRAIAVERLLAQPTAKRCVDCQSRYEKSHPVLPRFA